ncbi:hypothetical protein [Streptomyces sp. XD-27]|uniref:hypothetical protein n=1 Tax=Streptomyces sp. XD-27 TaxID=3062779 RepID=UPI0026F46871|nr:hypothetical protein [Streptomyces sp. XD-27]WKX71083.1 hypothetical protein Q3Y56_15225 [Streptomyces sp. XD-27]
MYDPPLLWLGLVHCDRQTNSYNAERRKVDRPTSSLPKAALQEPIPNLFDGVEAPGRTRGGALSPKRPAIEKAGLADVFPYYAGFSFEWACNQLIKWEASGIVLDPWNGSGTTTLAAQHVGLPSIGIDRNPVANVVARLRAEAGTRQEGFRRPRRAKSRKIETYASDPLAAWFTPETIARIRDWYRLIIRSDQGFYSVGLVALFRAVRTLTKDFEGSNPTWVKRAKDSASLVQLSDQDVDSAIEREISFVTTRTVEHATRTSTTALINGDSGRLPLMSESIDVVLTSPPYLTRIDYAVAYTRELAVLGVDISADPTLRYELMGTTLTRSSDSLNSHSLGHAASQMLGQIAQHDSKASSGYYLKQARQYLDDLTTGIDELSRVCKSEATMHLVVQDSFYKDIHVPLAGICIEEAAMRGWRLLHTDRFEVRRSLTSVNKAARAYKKGEVEESVITLRRG